MAHSSRHARIVNIKGPMGSGKTTELLRRLDIAKIRNKDGKKVAYVNSILDTRSSDGISTHNPNINLDHVRTWADIIVSSDLRAIDLSGYQVVGIDESQFHPYLFEKVFQLFKMGVDVYVAGLIGSSELEPMGDTHYLDPISTEIVILKGVCYFCGGDSTTSFLTEEEGGIGSIGKYQGACLACHVEQTKRRVRKTVDVEGTTV